MKLIFKHENLYAKLRYNIQHNNTDLRWRLFVKEGEEKELMFLCREVNTYVAGRTYKEEIEGVGHFSVLFHAPDIVIDENMVAWVGAMAYNKKNKKINHNGNS